MDRRDFLTTTTNVAVMPQAALGALFESIKTGTLEAGKKALHDLLVYRHKLAHSDPYDPDAQQPLDTLASLAQDYNELFKVIKKQWLEPIGNKPDLLDGVEAKQLSEHLTEIAKNLQETTDIISGKLEAVDEILNASRKYLPDLLSKATYESPVVFHYDVLSDIRSISDGGRPFYSGAAVENIEELEEGIRALNSVVTNAQIHQPRDWKEQREKNLLKHLRAQLKRLDAQYFSIELGPERGPGSADNYVISCKGHYANGENGKELPATVVESIRSMSVDLKLLADLHEGAEFSCSPCKQYPLLFEQQMAVSYPGFALRRALADAHTDLLGKKHQTSDAHQPVAGAQR